MTILPREERLDNCIEWLTDLLESNFEQETGRLARGEARCCLGVGNQVAHEPLQGKDKFPKGRPTRVEAKNFGLKNEHPKSGEGHLVSMNDGGYSHPEIAKAVLQQPKLVISKDIVEDVINYFTFGEY